MPGPPNFFARTSKRECDNLKAQLAETKIAIRKRECDNLEARLAEEMRKYDEEARQVAENEKKRRPERE